MLEGVGMMCFGNAGSRTALRRRADRKVQVASSRYPRTCWLVLGIFVGVCVTALLLASYDLGLVKCLRSQVQGGTRQCFAVQVYGVGAVVSVILTIGLTIWTILRGHRR